MSVNDDILSLEAFKHLWRQSGERDNEPTMSTAWQRYQQVNSPEYVKETESVDFSLDEIQDFYTLLMQHKEIKPYYAKISFLSLNANSVPWRPSGIVVQDDQLISVLPTGRTWRSKVLDLYLRPQFNIWYRIGVNGSIFNSTHDTKSFKCIDGQGGELYVANQFPGAFHDRAGGRVGGNLTSYDNAEGVFNMLIIQWKSGMTIFDYPRLLEKMLDIGHKMNHQSSALSPLILVSKSLERMSSDYYTHRFPIGWKLLWFLGESEIFNREQIQTSDDEEAVPAIRCSPYGNVGILQKDLTEPFSLEANTSVTWSWNISALPSRLREDTTISHDYLSIAFEFENGRDLTYTWSWNLPLGFGYWCPLAAWCDREYHVVVRSGSQDLGQWLGEDRNIYEDYLKYVNEDDSARYMPKQIVRVWLIAGNRWQRYHGEMIIKQIKLRQGGCDALDIL